MKRIESPRYWPREIWHLKRYDDWNELFQIMYCPGMAMFEADNG